MDGQVLSRSVNDLIRVARCNHTEPELVAVERRHSPPAEKTHQRERRTDRLASVSDDALVVTIRRAPSDVAGDLFNLGAALTPPRIEHYHGHLGFDVRPVSAQSIRNLGVDACGLTEKCRKGRICHGSGRHLCQAQHRCRTQECNGYPEVPQERQRVESLLQSSAQQITRVILASPTALSPNTREDRLFHRLCKTNVASPVALPS